MQNLIVRKISLLYGCFVWFALALAARGDTFQLTTGKAVTGEVLATSANNAGLQIKTGEGEYERVPWASFSQEDLRKFAQNKKLEAFVEPFIEVTQEERIKKTEVVIKQPTRLPHLEHQSFFGAMFSSGLGLFIALLLYAANIYAGYEIAIFKAQSLGLVCGVSAVAPFIGPIIFLSIPRKLPTVTETWETAAPAPTETVNPMQGEAPKSGLAMAAPATGATADADNPMQGEGVEHPSGLKLAQAEAAPAKAAAAPTVKYQRGQTTFNRRFFETKFPGFFGVVRRDADKDMLLVIKSSRGEYAGDRITRIAANDLHLQVPHGGATQEVMIPFQEIKEIYLKPKDPQ